MKVEFELWHLITLALTLVGMFTGLGKLLLMQFERRIDDRLGSFTEDSKEWRETSRDLLILKAELAEKYVRREDYIRGQTVIEAKLDAINSELRRSYQGGKT